MSLYPSTLPRGFVRGHEGQHNAQVDGNGVLEDCWLPEGRLLPEGTPGAGNVTQTTSNTTSVTVTARAARGRITMAAVVVKSTANEFVFNNPLITATSVMFLSVERGATNGGLGSSASCIAYVRTLSAGAAIIRVHNPDADYDTDAAPIVHYKIEST